MYDELDFDDDYLGDDNLSDEEDFGCCFPGKCCMPGMHYRDECHAAEMMEQMIADGEA
jgi:hypothetical protein